MFTETNFSSYSRNSKQARFNVARDRGRVYYEQDGSGWFPDSHYLHGKIDELMYEVPGKDNYPGQLTDNAFNLLKHRVDLQNKTVLNTARYTRHYKVLQGLWD
jgi:hypothetical protein